MHTLHCYYGMTFRRSNIAAKAYSGLFNKLCFMFLSVVKEYFVGKCNKIYDEMCKRSTCSVSNLMA